MSLIYSTAFEENIKYKVVRDTLVQQAIRLSSGSHTALEFALGLDGLGGLQLVAGDTLEQTRRLEQHAAEDCLRARVTREDTRSDALRMLTSTTTEWRKKMWCGGCEPLSH